MWAGTGSVGLFWMVRFGLFFCLLSSLPFVASFVDERFEGDTFEDGGVDEGGDECPERERELTRFGIDRNRSCRKASWTTS